MVDNEIRDGAGPEANEHVDVAQMHTPIYREHQEPEDGYEPVPVIWILLALALALWGGWYLATFSAHFSSALCDGSPETSQVLAGNAKNPVDPLVLGRRIFANCMACHQQDGKGLAGQFPPLAGSEWVLGEPRLLARILLQGLNGEIQVSGESYNSVMPAWGRFDDEQIAAVLTFIRTSWGNAAGSVSPELIATERQATIGQSSAWSARELQELKL